jgi:hypothetical protein
MLPQSRILVLGAGELGTAVLGNLVRHGANKAANITVLLRKETINTQSDAKKAELNHLKSLGINFLPGDIVHNNESELAELFKDFGTVIGCTGMSAVPGVQVKLTNAVLAAGVHRYIPWQFGVDYDIIGPGSSQNLFSEQLEVRTLLKGQSATEWIIISTGMFMSFLFEEMFGVVSADRRTVRALGSWANRVTVTSVEDIGRMTAEVVFAEMEWSRVVFIAGDTVSYESLADILDTVGGGKVTRVEDTLDALKEDLKKDPENGIKKYRVVFAEGRGVAWDLEETMNKKRDIALQNVESWLRKQGNRENCTI